jgi:hypothetical protein
VTIAMDRVLGQEAFGGGCQSNKFYDHEIPGCDGRTSRIVDVLGRLRQGCSRLRGAKRCGLLRGAVRHEALLIRMEVGDLCRLAVVAAG